jgi:hypothetical protein
MDENTPSGLWSRGMAATLIAQLGLTRTPRFEPAGVAAL